MFEFMTGVGLNTQNARVRADILTGVNVLNLIGSTFHIGYGTDPDEMLRNRRYLEIFTVVQPQ